MYSFAKRLLDIAISGAALIVLFPLLVAIAVVILVESGSPVLFKQERVGRHGATFKIFKFRSMRKSLAGEENNWFTKVGDSRITRCGKWLRKSSLDELPQLWNVFVGDMSLIGPRPDVPQQRDIYTDDEWLLRTSIRPGITGLAQASGRSTASVEERKSADLRYVNEHSYGMDMRIVAMTVKQVFLRGGN